MKLSELLNSYFAEINWLDIQKNDKKIATIYDHDTMIQDLGNCDVIRWGICSDGSECGIMVELMVPVPKTVIAIDEEGLKMHEEVVCSTAVDFMDSLPTQDPNKYDSYDIRNLRIPRGAMNKLTQNGFSKIADLRETTVEDLLAIPRIGKRYVEDIRRALYEFGCHLKEDDYYKPRSPVAKNIKRADKLV